MKYVRTRQGEALVLERDTAGNPTSTLTSVRVEVNDATALAYQAVAAAAGVELVVAPSPTPEGGFAPETYLATRGWVEDYAGGVLTGAAADAQAARDAAATQAGIATTKAGEAAASAAAAIQAWQAGHVYAAGDIAVAPADGSRIKRLTPGTSRGTFDATEQTAWKPVSTSAGTLEQVALAGTFSPQAGTKPATLFSGASPAAQITAAASSAGLHGAVVAGPTLRPVADPGPNVASDLILADGVFLDDMRGAYGTVSNQAVKVARHFYKQFGAMTQSGPPYALAADNEFTIGIEAFLTAGTSGDDGSGPYGENGALFLGLRRKNTSARAAYGINLQVSDYYGPSTTTARNLRGFEIDMGNNVADATLSTVYDGIAVLAGTHKSRYAFVAGQGSSGGGFLEALHVQSSDKLLTYVPTDDLSTSKALSFRNSANSADVVTINNDGSSVFAQNMQARDVIAARSSTTGQLTMGSGGAPAFFFFNGSNIQFSHPLKAMSTTCQIIGGSGSPEGVITAAIGSIYLRSNGGAATSLYVKESGTGNTGWVGK